MNNNSDTSAEVEIAISTKGRLINHIPIKPLQQGVPHGLKFNREYFV
jgi:hypothetical protein